MLANDIKEDMELMFYDGREGRMVDNKRGIIRTVEIYGKNGFFNDFGSCYINEISAVKVGDTWEKVELTNGNRKKLAQCTRV